MAPAHHFSAAPSMPMWDITFTRLAQAVQPQLDACGLALARRFKAIGWACDSSVRQTPRGVSTLLALFGQRGLICIVDMTLIDGMAVGQGPCAALDMRLLDACGDVVAEGLANGELSHPFHAHLAAQALNAEQLERAVTAVYVASLAHFDLLRPAASSVQH